MQSVSAAFTAEEKDQVRKIAQGTLVSWKKDFRSDIVFFTIGVSTIGGNDIIAGEAGVQSAWNKYLYFDETAYVTELDWERELNQPIGGITKSLADIELDNTSGRFTPRYMGGDSELFTALLPRRPVIINAGFDVGGVDQTIPQFVGITTKAPKIDTRSKRIQLEAADFVDFLQNRYLDQTAMFTGQRVDQIIETILTDQGYSTAQYDLDTGINPIPFAMFEKGARLSNIINDLVQSEFGHFYQDEEGRLRFENFYHWTSSPHTSVQKVITTSMVIDAQAPNDDHIINVVEVKSQVREKQQSQIIYELFAPLEIDPSSSKSFFLEFEFPVLAMTTPVGDAAESSASFFRAFNQSDGTGSELTSSVTVSKVDKFANSAKIEFTNANTQRVYVTRLVISGRPAKITRDVYFRDSDSSSVTAFEERPLLLENDFIHSKDWAASIARQITEQYSDPENLQRLTIRAIPELQLGDQISWQGRYWRVFSIRTKLDPGNGFIQDLELLQRTIQIFFRVGISTIGGPDKIAG